MRIRCAKDFIIHFGLNTAEYVVGEVFKIHESRNIWNINIDELKEYILILQNFEEMMYDFENIENVLKFYADVEEGDEELHEFRFDGNDTVMTRREFGEYVEQHLKFVNEYRQTNFYISNEFWRL